MGWGTPPLDLSALTRGELEGVVLTLWKPLEALESKVAKNSSNSSQPPSLDGLCKSNSLRVLCSGEARRLCSQFLRGADSRREASSLKSLEIVGHGNRIRNNGRLSACAYLSEGSGGRNPSLRVSICASRCRLPN